MGLVEEPDVASDFQLFAFEPDVALVGLAVLGIVDFSVLPLIVLLLQSAQDVDSNEISLEQTRVAVVFVLRLRPFLQPHDFTVYLVAGLIDFHLSVAGFSKPLAHDVLCVATSCHQQKSHT